MAHESPLAQNILVIMHGALGDWIFATASFQAIRSTYPTAHIIILTGSPFAEISKSSPFFDEVWIDDRPKLYQIKSSISVLRKLRSRKFDIVYDLKNSSRTTWYYLWMQGGFSLWSSKVARSSKHFWIDIPMSHIMNRLEMQLNAYHVKNVAPLPQIDWMEHLFTKKVLTKPYALIIPSTSNTAFKKSVARRWPFNQFEALLNRLHSKGIQPYLIGNPKEFAQHPNYIGETTLPELVSIAKGATFAVGGDTGPTHLCSASGCRTLTLYGSHHSSITNAPRGKQTALLLKVPLNTLPEEEVANKLIEMDWLQ